MRKLSVLFLLTIIMVSVASAELLSTANPIGKGGWAVLGAGVQDNNYSGIPGTSWTLTTIGGYVGYGITDKLDAYLQLGSATVGGLPAGVSASGTGIGVNAKYTLLSEENAPVSVAVGAGYKSTSSKMTGAPDSTGTQILIGIGVSKLIIPFIPYGALSYRQTKSEGNDVSTQLDITVGSAVAWSTQGAVFVEYTNQAFTPASGTGLGNYTSGQIAIGVGYKI